MEVLRSLLLPSRASVDAKVPDKGWKRNALMAAAGIGGLVLCRYGFKKLFGRPKGDPDGRKPFKGAKYSVDDQKALVKSNHQGLGLHWTEKGKYINAALHMLGHVPTALCFLGTSLGGKWTWLTTIVGWGVVPILDVIIGADSYNLTDDEEKDWKDFIGFRAVTWLHLPLQICALTWTCKWISEHTLSTSEWLGIVVSMGTAQGFGIGCVHEMLHRPSLYDTMNSMISLCFSSYGHFWIEHLWGHHRNVATDLDCASSKKGDISWFFVPKCIMRTAIESWQMETKIVRSRGHHPLNPYHNRFIIAWLTTGAIALAYKTLFGPEVLSFFFGQGFIAGYIVDNTNFIEHYGLRRRELTPGHYETVGWMHSWDTPDFLTNYILFKIQRHPDHHTNADRPYQVLRTYKDAPTLPTGYAGCIVMSWFPMLWRAVMDWRVDMVQEQAYELATKGSVNGEMYIFPDGARAVASHFKNEDHIFLEDAEINRDALATLIRQASTVKPKNDRGLERVDDERENVATRWMSLGLLAGAGGIFAKNVLLPAMREGCQTPLTVAA